MNVIGTIAVVVITSLYYFPFNCSLFPSVNTKLILASIGFLMNVCACVAAVCIQ